jgi:hypothetical protein
VNARFETPKRFSATGVATAGMLIVMLAMAISILFPSDSPPPSATATARGPQLAQPIVANRLKKS